ncbi:hypothetical protein B0H14DRAFT_2624501 [Mycena olivaceomarginata]|nr:hypothetical protein B0H14DRAFT_2624501 [Mycena olivaceomarginata]
MGGWSVARRDEAMRRLMCGYSPHLQWTWDVAFSAHIPVCPTDLVASHFCRAFLEAEKFGLHSDYGPHIDGKGILSFTTNVCATTAVRYIGGTWFRFADAANAQQAVSMLAEEVWGEVSNDTAVASVTEIEEVEAEVQRTLDIARFLAGPVTQAVWPTMLLDPFFHLPNLRDEWDHLGSAHSLEVMSLTSMMQRSLLPNVLNNRARDMMHDAAAARASSPHGRAGCCAGVHRTEMLDVTEICFGRARRQPFRQRRPMSVPSEIAFNPANNGEFRVPLPSTAVKFRVPSTAVNFVFSQLQ